MSMRKLAIMLSGMLAIPAHAQGLVSPEFALSENSHVCSLVAALPDTELEALRVPIPFGNAPLKGLEVSMPKTATEAAAEAMLGVNGNPPLDMSLTWLPADDGHWAFVRMDERPELSQAIRGGTPAVLRVGGDVIDLSQLGQWIDKAHDCTKQKLMVQGIDVDDYSGGLGLIQTGDDDGEVPVKRLLGLFSMSDYPDAALRQEAQGTVRVYLFLDDRGKVDHCLVIQSAHELLDQATCDVYRKRLKAKPPKDASGNPVKFILESPPIRWSIPLL